MAAGEGGSKTLGKGGDRSKIYFVSAVCKCLLDGHSYGGHVWCTWGVDGEPHINKWNESDGFRYTQVSVAESQAQSSVVLVLGQLMCQYKQSATIR